MAYLPGFRHDVFISYAHQDLAWVNSLQEQLTDRLSDQLGTACNVWQDHNHLRAGQHWSEEIVTAIREAAVFLAVISLHYQGSGWCERELEEFLAGAGLRHGLRSGGHGRFVKVIKLPWHLESHNNFYGDFQHVPFFDRDPKTGQVREFKKGSAKFGHGIETLSFHIERLFKEMLKSMSKVYVARAADDNRGERDAIARQIKEEGYALMPPPDGAIPRGLDKKGLADFILEAPTSVHVLGAGYDPMVRTQIDLAIEADKLLIFCLVPGHESAVGEQAKLIESIRVNRWNLNEGRWRLLESRSRQTLLHDLVLLLAPGAPAVAAAADTASRVYLLCDPTTPDDASFGREIQKQIQEQEQMRVDLPQVAADTSSPGAQHERLMRECDGLLVYCEKAPTGWYNRNVIDLLTAEQRPRARALRSKALYVGNLPVAWPGLTVIHRSDPFDLGQLEPFLHPLRVPPPGPGGRGQPDHDGR